MITKSDDMQESLLNGGRLEVIELDEVAEEGVCEVTNPELPKSDLYRFLKFQFDQNSRITSVPRVVASALYLTSGIQTSTWMRTVGSSITLVSSVLGVIINQNKEKDITPEGSRWEYFVEMLKRSFQPIDHIRQFTGPLLFLSSTCLGIGGIMSSRYTELAFTATGWVLGGIYMFAPKDIDANLYAYRFRMLIMPIIFGMSGWEAFAAADSIAISSMVLNQTSTIFSGSINAWGKMYVEPYDEGRTCLNFLKICCWSRRHAVKQDDPDGLSVLR